jgi:hypothetical protein
LLLT